MAVSSCLQTLDVSHNNISDIPKRILDYYPKLTHLLISYNRLHSVPQLTKLVSHPVKVLRVSYNVLQELTSDVLHGLTSLQLFKPQSNNITPDVLSFPSSLYEST